MNFKEKNKRFSMPSLVASLDRWFKLFIRLRDKDKPCISCGCWYTSTNIMHAGHYHPSTHRGTRWHEKNVNGQCNSCNTYRGSNGAAYTIGLIKKYGQSVIDELAIAKARHPHFTRTDLEWMIAEYKQKAKQLRGA